MNGSPLLNQTNFLLSDLSLVSCLAIILVIYIFLLVDYLCCFIVNFLISEFCWRSL